MSFDKYEETFKTWNKIAELYEHKFMELDLYNDSYDLFCNALNNQKAKILEVGCGPGNITKYLLTKCPDLDILGIDVAPSMIALAQKNCPSASFAVMDCRQIDKIETRFDAIVCGFCLPYLSPSDTSKFMADCGNLLKNNGLIYVSFVEGNPVDSGFQVGSTGDRSFFNYHQLDDLLLTLRDNNFDNFEVMKVEYEKLSGHKEIHTILIALKR